MFLSLHYQEVQLIIIRASKVLLLVVLYIIPTMTTRATNLHCRLEKLVVSIATTIPRGPRRILCLYFSQLESLVVSMMTTIPSETMRILDLNSITPKTMATKMSAQIANLKRRLGNIPTQTLIAISPSRYLMLSTTSFNISLKASSVMSRNTKRPFKSTIGNYRDKTTTTPIARTWSFLVERRTRDTIRIFLTSLIKSTFIEARR